MKIIGIVLLFISGCEKDHNDIPKNLTNDKTTAVFNSDLKYGTMTDQDGNIYKTITIGTQTWMAENLRATKYRNGDKIPIITDNKQWSDLNTGACCNYKNTNNVDTIATYGRLYNWYTVDDPRNIAPIGWHVPTDNDWKILIAYLGDAINVGGKLKEASLVHWGNPNVLATNETGFTALPGGFRSEIGYFYNLTYYGYWWASTSENDLFACYRSLQYNYPLVSGDFYDWENKQEGLSVRCIKD